MGTREYEPIARRHRVPIVVSGFEPVDILDGVLRVVRQLEAGHGQVEIAYARVVRPEGNAPALKLIGEVFEVCDRKWRGIGNVPRSGYRLRDDLRAYDAERIYEVDTIEARESSECISGQVLKGLKKPRDCPAFGSSCTPESPLGATMVSAEGACAAYFAYGRHLQPRAGRALPLAPGGGAV